MNLPIGRLLLSGLLALAFQGQPLRAQGEVIIECLSFPKMSPTPELEVLVGEGKTEIIKIPSHTLSDPLKLPRLAVWKFGKSGEDAEGKFTFKTYAQVRPLSARKQLLVFIGKGRKPEQGFGIVALNGSRNGFGAKKFMIMNLARQEVAGEVGDRKFRLQPGKHVIIEPKANRGPNLCYANLLYQRKEKWRSFFSTNWPLLEESRGMVFIFQDPKRGTMQMHSVVDSLKTFPKEDDGG